ncbi:MAG: CPBP family intramembrane metalloprotease [Sphingobacteriales bacterium]|nr:MAG: CPBP family intramembrane metalloprotease [Sphingobacteriales bacterium]
MGNKFLYYLTPILRVFVFVFFIFLWAVPFGFLSQLGVFKFSPDGLSGQLFSEVCAILVVIGALLMIFHIYPTRNFETVFIKSDVLVPFFKGGLTGLLLIGSCALIMFLAGNVMFTTTQINLLDIVGYMFFFIFVGIFEEFTFRSFPLVVFAERYLIAFTVILNGLLFGLIHFSNPGFSLLAMINISLCGVLFAIITLTKRNIWWSVGIHFGWNFTQGNLLGFKVSGINQSGLVAANPKGNYLLSGASFGIEGSVICTVILIIYITWLIIKLKIPPVIEIENHHELIEE